jgi:tRNA(Ile2) C34 agmatinyltransferase TiaS
MEWSCYRPLSVLYWAWWSLRQGRLWVRRHVVEPLDPRRCAHCGHRFIPALSSSWYRCRACMYVQSQQQTVDDLPF